MWHLMRVIVDSLGRAESHRGQNGLQFSFREGRPSQGYFLPREKRNGSGGAWLVLRPSAGWPLLQMLTSVCKQMIPWRKRRVQSTMRIIGTSKIMIIRKSVDIISNPDFLSGVCHSRTACMSEGALILHL